MSGSCPSSSSLRNNSWLVFVSAPTFIENPENVNVAASQQGDSVEQQLQLWKYGIRCLGNICRWLPTKKNTSELLDREAPKFNENIPQLGTSAVLAIKTSTKAGNTCLNWYIESAGIICSSAEKTGSLCTWWHSGGWKSTEGWIPSLESIVHLCPQVKFKLPSTS